MRGKPRVHLLLRAALEQAPSQAWFLRFASAHGWKPRRLGAGGFRTAYRLTIAGRDYVVKREQPYRYPCGRSATTQVFEAPSVLINGWEVQHFYTRVPTKLEPWLNRLTGDLKIENVGVDTDGTLIAFDY